MKIYIGFASYAEHDLDGIFIRNVTESKSSTDAFKVLSWLAQLRYQGKPERGIYDFQMTVIRITTYELGGIKQEKAKLGLGNNGDITVEGWEIDGEKSIPKSEKEIGERAQTKGS